MGFTLLDLQFSVKCFCRSWFVLFLLAMVTRFTDLDDPFGIYKID